MLGHLRFPAARSEGRRYPEPEHSYRNPFQRDRDRIVHARAFRRLEAKTQVFTPGLSDHFRNRLTHTIEVAQIARTVAGALDLDGDLTEALALAHDIGHPPFSHAGEEELNRQMRRFGDVFEHNRHALRIVERFEQRYARFPGLNLTFEVREGILKHSRDYQPGELDEAEEYRPGERPPLEAQIIDLADEIAYNSADLDDGYSAGMFTIADLAAAAPHYGEIYETFEYQFPGATERERFHEALRALIDYLVSGLIRNTEAAAAAAGVGNFEDVRRAPRLAGFDAATGAVNAQLKAFLKKHIYTSDLLVEERRKSMARVAELFELFRQRPELMPEAYREETGQPWHRTVCDYIAGMTDSYFDRVYDSVIPRSAE